MTQDQAHRERQADPAKPGAGFKKGDAVVRRPGTLGNMDGRGEVGTVRQIGTKGAHTVLTVDFPSHTETFVADTYAPAYRT